MNELPLLMDFYDKKAVSIGVHDKGMLSRGEGAIYEGVTHWLIALIWCERKQERGWKVSVYPTCPEKPFWYLSPFFETDVLHPFEVAFKISQILVSHSKRDVLTKKLFVQEMSHLSRMQRA
ncbi:hypothetical protein [Thermoactinomyces sp. DSM 45892]|uniref:hypothetical protein n=1 Tax=Thermoactinomyces sp. DSM 45892 TaxID=1882753 RepID=UPI00089826FE|nr:hypothetical protein [Thermoactinomyces sp. DSM 45892]SDY04966.1 hypothetical protein SAMN05444416_101334 [Thermoactinomyces sp. DSM 45892]